MEKSAEAVNARLVRVPGVDGAEIDPGDWIDVDWDRFRRSHGRRILPGEYGCYRSHLAALEAVMDSGDPVGVICEDDVVLSAETGSVVEAVLSEKPDLHVLKLFNNRLQGFVRHGGSSPFEVFGRCIHGPQGAAACYAVTREGAQIVHAALSRMWLPFDVALERGWDYGGRVYTMRRNVVGFGPLNKKSTIITSKASRYKHTKPFFLKRIPVAMFRGVDYVRRARYALG
ncbi:glycosyltransferase family 25 protein [Jiella sp. LLJ827]|nr:glycosyltransferase family 25 protein [Jiella sp. LLJ827]